MGYTNKEGNKMEKKTYSFKDMMATPLEKGEDEYLKYRRMKYRKTDTTSESVEQEVEQDLDEKIDIVTRLKKGRDMKRNKIRLAIARKKASHRTADKKRIDVRSRKSARKAMFKKLSKGKNPSDLSPARRQEIENRLNNKQFQTRIGVTAKKLRPKMRELDRSRKNTTGK